MDPQILGDGLTFTTATRHQHRLVPVTESSISGGLEQVFQLPLFLCRESDPLHFVHSPLMRNCSRGYLKKDARSAAACISRGSLKLKNACHNPATNTLNQADFVLDEKF